MNTGSEPDDRQRSGQTWALVACLLLVAFSYLGETLVELVNHVLPASRVHLPIVLPSWLIAITIPMTLLNLSATVLRRTGLSVITLLVDVAHLIGLGLFVVMLIADISVSVSVFELRTVMAFLVAALLSTAGTVVSFFGVRRRWSPSATFGVILAVLGALLAGTSEVLVGPLTPVFTRTLSEALLPLLLPAVVLLIGLAVAFGRWWLSAIAVVAQIVLLVTPIRSLVTWSAAMAAVDRPQWIIMPVGVTVVGLVLALVAAIGLTVAVFRGRPVKAPTAQVG